MAEAFAALVGLLTRLEDERPYVTVDDVCQPGDLPLDVAGAQALVAHDLFGEDAGDGVPQNRSRQSEVTLMCVRLEPARGRLQAYRVKEAFAALGRKGPKPADCSGCHIRVQRCSE